MTTKTPTVGIGEREMPTIWSKTYDEKVTRRHTNPARTCDGCGEVVALKRTIWIEKRYRTGEYRPFFSRRLCSICKWIEW